ncbi:hypothetical protein TgHK011_008704 [Trichoderma gracile]|nr:hypothetical protein TgHK011_008704 [Trichoderma gracile]
MVPACVQSRLEMQDARTHDGERCTFASGTEFHDASIVQGEARTATLPGSCGPGGRRFSMGSPQARVRRCKAFLHFGLDVRAAAIAVLGPCHDSSELQLASGRQSSRIAANCQPLALGLSPSF